MLQITIRNGELYPGGTWFRASILRALLVSSEPFATAIFSGQSWWSKVLSILNFNTNFSRYITDWLSCSQRESRHSGSMLWSWQLPHCSLLWRGASISEGCTGAMPICLWPRSYGDIIEFSWWIWWCTWLYGCTATLSIPRRPSNPSRPQSITLLSCSAI